jgi:hypothetical protein
MNAKFIRTSILLAVPAMEEQQRELCQRYGANYVPSPPFLKVGLARRLPPGPTADQRPQAPATGRNVWLVYLAWRRTKIRS